MRTARRRWVGTWTAAGKMVWAWLSNSAPVPADGASRCCTSSAQPKPMENSPRQAWSLMAPAIFTARQHLRDLMLAQCLKSRRSGASGRAGLGVVRLIFFCVCKKKYGQTKGLEKKQYADEDDDSKFAVSFIFCSAQFFPGCRCAGAGVHRHP